MKIGGLRIMVNLKARMPRPRIGLLAIGHFYYWPQFPRLREMSLRMYTKLRQHLDKIGDVFTPGLVDSMEKSQKAGEFFRKQNIDILFIFPLQYSTGMTVVPAVKDLDVPIRILNAHEDSSYDYKTADTAIYLHHEGVCCVPEIAGTLLCLGKKFKVRTGPFSSQRLWDEVRADCIGAAAARVFRSLNFGLIGETYRLSKEGSSMGMTDMPIDEHRLLRATGKLLIHPEVEEIEEAYHRVTEEQLEDMYRQFREMYDVDETVTNEHMKESAKIAIAFDEIIRKKYNIHAFGYYWWGEKTFVTQLRAQSALAVSRLAALGHPGVTEGDVKAAMAMKVLDLLGGGGMFVEFFSMDFDENFILLGHDGPVNINMAEGRARLKHLEIHHGKSGHGLGIDFEIKKGPATLLNLTQFDAGNTFKLIYTVGEVIPGPILNIGNPNCRFRVKRPIHEFIDAWCQEGPEHHSALGIGDLSREIEAFAEAMKFRCVRI